MKVSITYRKKPFAITFEWETPKQQSENEFNTECFRLMKKLEELGATIY